MGIKERSFVPFIHVSLEEHQTPHSAVSIHNFGNIAWSDDSSMRGCFIVLPDKQAP
jgi:hypothetical protein